MLTSITRRPLLARAFHAALTSSVRTPSLASSHLLSSSSSLISLLRPSILSTYRHFANAASSPSPAATPTTASPAPPPASASSSSPSADNSTPSKSKSTSGSSAPTTAARKRGRSALTAEQQKAADNRAKQLLRAKQQERARKERERSIAARLKKEHRRIIAQERARERSTLTKQRRQHLKDTLRAKATRDKQLRAEERAVAQQYKALQSTRPKKPLPPFIAYAQSIRSSLPASESTRPTETTRLLAARWRELTAADKAKWEAEFKAAIPAYEQALQQWNEQQRTHRPPVRPLNPYARYAQRRFKDILAAEGGGQKASELMKRVAAEWKGSVSGEEKERLRSEVAADMAGYQERLKEWERRPADELAMWRLQRSTQRKKRERRKARTALNKQAADKLGSGAQQ